MNRALLVVLAACSSHASSPAPPAPIAATGALGARGALGLRAISPARIEAATKYLASDELSGRFPGTFGGVLAEAYMAEQMKQIGLEPAGDTGTYFQAVPMRRADRDDAATSVTIARGDSHVALAARTEMFAWPFPRGADVTIDAPLAFVGFGIAIPGYDDLTGADVAGKIAVIYVGAPRTIAGRTLDSAEHALFSDIKVRSVALRARGAVAIFAIYDPVRAELTPFPDWVDKMVGPNMGWLEHGEVGSLGVLPLVTISEDAADKLAGAPTFHAIWQQLDRGIVARPPPLAATAAIRIHSRLTDLTGRNVAGLVRGTDPSAGTIVFTAHHDHLGIGAPIGSNPDTIYNGALDNAIGCAGLLEIARAFMALPERPRRSILFLAVTGEEQGLLGSDYFAAHPTIPFAELAANINLDGLGGLWELHDVVPLGAEHSTLARDAAAAAAALGLAVSADPEPGAVAFIRSDQYSFAKRGIPAAFPDAGYLDATGARDHNRGTSDAWGAMRYHRPTDEWFEGVHAEWAAQLAAFDFLFGLSAATTPARPQWNAGDPFATLR